MKNLTEIKNEVINQLLLEKAPPGREKQVKKLKKVLPKTYKKGKKRVKSNVYAVAWSSYKKSKRRK